MRAAPAQTGQPAAALGAMLRAAALAALLATLGCTATIDNDDEAWGGGQGKDRWYTAGARFERPAVAAGEDSLGGWIDGVVLAVAQALPSAGAVGPGSVSAASGVAGLQVYTPEDTETSLPIPDDRPYAGWVYAGVVRYDTWLDPDTLRRADAQSSVELDVGLVGPTTHIDDLQRTMHGYFDKDEAEGWDNQLDDEPGLILRAARRWRADYAELDPSGLAFDLIPGVDGALGNIDTHVGAGGVARLGLNLSRALDPLAGDPARLSPGGSAREPPASLYLFTGVDGRFVIHNLFLDGNTFEDSLSVTKERLVGEGVIGVGWERGPWRVAYGLHLRSREFEDQDEHQAYGSVTVSWTPAP